MPHICTHCNSTFESGEDILKGCPACGGKKFMFVRRKAAVGKADLAPSEPIITREMGVRVPPRRSEEKDEEEMRDKLRKRTGPSSAHQTSQGGKEAAKDGKVESIMITAPGTYELNLPSLFERDELIMAVKEGTYFIDLSSALKKSKKS